METCFLQTFSNQGIQSFLDLAVTNSTNSFSLLHSAVSTKRSVAGFNSVGNEAWSKKTHRLADPTSFGFKKSWRFKVPHQDVQDGTTREHDGLIKSNCFFLKKDSLFVFSLLKKNYTCSAEIGNIGKTSLITMSQRQELCFWTPLPWTSTSVFARTVAGLGMDAPMRPRPLPN